MAHNHFNTTRVRPVYSGPPKPESFSAVQTLRSGTSHENRFNHSRGALETVDRGPRKASSSVPIGCNPERFRPALKGEVSTQEIR